MKCDDEEAIAELDETTGDPEDDAANGEWVTSPDAEANHDAANPKSLEERAEEPEEK